MFTILNEYMYDHMGRKTKTWQTITNYKQAADTRTLLSQLVYNEIRQVRYKYLHSDRTSMMNFKQTVSYAYNERGWLVTSFAPLFAMQLTYNDGTTPQFKLYNSIFFNINCVCYSHSFGFRIR